MRGRSGLEQHQFHFALRHGIVRHAARHDVDIPCLQHDLAIFILDDQAARQDEKDFVLVGVIVPDELAVNLGDLEVLAVGLRHDTRRPVLGESTGGGVQVDDGAGQGASP